MSFPLVRRLSLVASLMATSGALATPPTAAQMQELLRSRPEIDAIQWKDPARGAALTVRILAADSHEIIVEKQLAAGLTQRRLRLAELASIHIGRTPQEAELHRHPRAEATGALRVLWNARKATLGFPGSTVAETGIALAKALRASVTDEAFAEAAEVLSFLIAKDSDPRRITLARSEREVLSFIRALSRNDPPEADQAAWRIVENIDAGHSEAMLLATAWLADRHFQQWKSIEEENPRWIEDIEVKPLRDRAYHLALDFALYPSLFESESTAEAAIGLAKAARIYQHARQTVAWCNTLEDLCALYPESPEAAEAEPLLASLRESPAAPSSPEDARNPEPAPVEEESPASDPITAPPPPHRYPLFGD